MWLRKNSSSDDEKDKKPVPKPLPKKIDRSALEAAMKLQEVQAKKPVEAPRKIS